MVVAAVAEPAAERDVHVAVGETQCSALFLDGGVHGHVSGRRRDCRRDVDWETCDVGAIGEVLGEHLPFGTCHEADRVDDVRGRVDDRRARDPDRVDLRRAVVGRHARPGDHVPDDGPGAFVQGVDAVVLGDGDDEPVPDQGLGVDVAVQRGVPLR